jgi:hypothetical protein
MVELKVCLFESQMRYDVDFVCVVSEAAKCFLGGYFSKILGILS